MITKEQLQAMLNFEISEKLCDLLGYRVQRVYPYHESEMPTALVSTGKDGETVGEWFTVEFGRPDCIMPLAFEYKIGLLDLADGS